jgi:hypothetical protein
MQQRWKYASISEFKLEESNGANKYTLAHSIHTDMNMHMPWQTQQQQENYFIIRWGGEHKQQQVRVEPKYDAA